MSRFTSWLSVAVAAGFLVVASVGFGASTSATLGVIVSIVTLIVSVGIAYTYRRHPPTAITAVLTAAVSAWTLVACLVFSSSTAQDLAFAGSLAVIALSLIGLTVHELSAQRTAHAAMDGADRPKAHMAAAA